MSIIIGNIGELASFIGSLTIVGSALIWIYNKFIGKPREQRREQKQKEIQEKMVLLITKEQSPLVNSIENLNYLLEESQKDRKKLNTVAEKNTKMLLEHDETIDEHNNRLIILETKNGLDEYRYQKRSD